MRLSSDAGAMITCGLSQLNSIRKVYSEGNVDLRWDVGGQFINDSVRQGFRYYMIAYLEEQGDMGEVII